MDFLKLWDKINEQSFEEYPAEEAPAAEEAPTEGNPEDGRKEALLDSGTGSEAEPVIRTGMTLRNKKECGSFWDDFIKITADSESLASLLDVDEDKIKNWESRIKEEIAKIEDADSEEGGKKADVIDTGTLDPVADISGAESPKDGPAETRPM
jgi:hypothetical protein